MCYEKDETFHRIVCGCSNLAQKECNNRHDYVAKEFHWNDLRQRGLLIRSKGLQHQPRSYDENVSTSKKLWYFTIIMDKDLNQAIMIHVAIPTDVNVRNKEQKKIIRYQDLSFS